MSRSELLEAMWQQIRAGEGLMTLRDTLVKFAAGGGTQTEAGNVLREMLEEASDEHTEDAIRDALDLVAGWCAPDLRIWPTVS